MHGTLDIRRASNPGSMPSVYHVRYEDLVGNSFVGSIEKDGLHDLLYAKLAMAIPDEDLDRDYDHLLSNGHIAFPIDLRESDLTGAGLRYLPPEG